ncbi:MAG: acyltransferase family protein [Zoogloea sp.]|uniref:acyltransferase family protein n=1 Tax=Zoogloea sp. TaxID=49181 RepID=UPI003F34ADA9
MQVQPTDTKAPSQHHTTDVRFDIEGMRGIAVLAVLIFHVNPTWLQGGFVGVDVFFVISGFVVGQRIVSEISRGGQFSYANFYWRRIRRILPILIVVLLTSLISAPLFFRGEAYQALGQQVSATAIFAANFLAWSQSGYFDADAAYKPLIHLWSLGIEEQFYAFLPLLLLLIWKDYLAHATAILLLSIVVLFSACVGLTYWDGSAAFYFPFTRFWELLAGTLLALHQYQSKLPTFARGLERYFDKNIFASLGLCLILGSLIFIQEGQYFPGWQAALPVLGTMFVLVGGPQAWPNRTLLSRGALPWLGRISYATYLWHWPILVFGRYATDSQMTSGLSVCLASFSVVLAWFSTRYVEAPFRSGKWSKNENVPKFLLLALVLVGAMAIVLPTAMDKSEPAAIARLDRYPQPDYDIWREGANCFVNLNKDIPFGQDCLGGQAEQLPLAIFWGDSHAAHLWPGLSAVTPIAHWRLGQLTVSQCPPLVSSAGEGNNKCPQMRARAWNAIRERKPQLVILASRWTLYQRKAVLDAIGDTVIALKSSGVERVIVIGPFPRWQPTLGKALATDMRKRGLQAPPLYTTTGFENDLWSMDELLRLAAQRAGATYISALDISCGTHSQCSAWGDAERTMLTTYDGGHLTRERSIWFAEQVSDLLFNH